MSVDVEGVLERHLRLDDKVHPRVGVREGNDVGRFRLVVLPTRDVEERGVRPVSDLADSVQCPAEDGAVGSGEGRWAGGKGADLRREAVGVDGCGDDGDQRGGRLVGAGVRDGDGLRGWQGGRGAGVGDHAVGDATETVVGVFAARTDHGTEPVGGDGLVGFDDHVVALADVDFYAACGVWGDGHEIGGDNSHCVVV